MGTLRSVNLQQVQAAVAVGDLDADIVAVDRARPVRDAVGVDLAARNADGRRVLVVGRDAGSLAAGERNGADRDEGSRSGKESGERSVHLDDGGCGVFCVVVSRETLERLALVYSQRTAMRSKNEVGCEMKDD